MVFLCPVHHGIRNIIIHHGTACRNVIPTGRPVGKTAVLLIPVIVSRHHPLQPGIIPVGMVVDHVHDHPKTVFVQRLNHLLAFPDPHCSIRHIRGVRSFRHVKVKRVISPVVLVPVSRFVHGSIIKKRKQMHIGDTQLFQIFHAGRIALSGFFYSKGFVFAAVHFRYAAVLIIGKVLDVKLVDDLFPFHRRRPVFRETFRIRLAKIHYHAPASIAVTADGIGIRRPYVLPLYPYQIVIIHPVEALREHPLPYPPLPKAHFPFQERLSAVFII